MIFDESVVCHFGPDPPRTFIRFSQSPILLINEYDDDDDDDDVSTPCPARKFPPTQNKRQRPTGLRRSQTKFRYKQTKYSLCKIEYGLSQKCIRTHDDVSLSLYTRYWNPSTNRIVCLCLS